MVTNKTTRLCEPCEPTCESFFYNGSHIKFLILNMNIIFVNDVNHLYVCARVNKITYYPFTLNILHKIIKNSCARNYKKSFTSFTFSNNAFNTLKNKVILCERFLLNYSQHDHIIHIC